MGRLAISLVLSAILLLVGCAPATVATLDEKLTCSSSVEGYYKTPPVWTGDAPALIAKRRYDDYQTMAGETKEVREDGIVFARDGKRPAHDPAPTFYPNDEIAAYINASGEIERGSLPPEEGTFWEMTLFVRPADSSEESTKRMILTPNSQFGFCMKPGTYIVDDIHFEDSENGKVDRAVHYGSIQFSVALDSANYLGTIKLNEDSLDGPAVYPIPVEPQERPNSSTGATLRAGWVLGESAQSTAMRNVQAIHALSVKQEPDFEPQSSAPLTPNLLQIDPNENIIEEIESDVDSADGQ